MFKKLIAIVVVLKLFYCVAQEDHSNYIHLVKDFLKVSNIPTRIIAYLCWPREIELTFWKTLMDLGFLVTVTKFDNVIHYDQPFQYQLFVLSLNCEGVEEILSQVEAMDLFRHPFRWIVWGNTSDELLNNYHLRLDSRIYVIRQDNSQYDIKLFYKRSNNSENLLVDNVGTWYLTRGFTTFDKSPTAARRSDLMGITLRAVHVATNPDTLNHLEDYNYKKKHIDSNTKVNWVVAKHLFSLLNATVDNKFTTIWGYKNHTTNKYSGMIGELQTLKADYGASPCFITAERIDIVDYVPFILPFKQKFIFKAPPLSYVTNIFTLPFDTFVWYSSFVLASIIFVVLYTIVYWEWNDEIYKETHVDVSHPLRANASDVVVMELGAITQQGAESEPTSISGKIATIFTFLMVMFLYTSYSANIVALLQTTSDSIKTIDDLLHSRITLGVEDILYQRYYFETVKEPIRKAIYQQKIAPKGQNPHFFSVEEGIRKMQNEFFAYHVELSSGYKMIADVFLQSEKCKLKEVEFINLGYPHVTLQKYSPYKEFIRVGLQKIHSSGLHARELNKIYTGKPNCHGGVGSNFGSVGLADCYGAFLIFGIGSSISLIVLLVEKIFKSYSKANKCY